MDHEKTPASTKHAAAPKTAQSAGVEDLFRRLRSELGPAKPGQEKVTAAIDAVQRLALQMDTDEAVATVAESAERRTCQSCGTLNPRDNRFCARCGVPLQLAPEGEAPAPSEVQLINPLTPGHGQHHYHHHYHHHYFASADAAAVPASPGTAAEPRALGAVPAVRDGSRSKTSGGVGLSRGEAAVRKLTQDWALACNTKHLDDMVELYIADATVLRPNVPVVRSTAAIHEYFFTVLEAGLGEVEMDAQRVELLGDVAYELGRCTMLVPTATGKRREERGKYVILSVKQAGEWKIMVDTWSNDLSLAETTAAKAPATVVRVPVK